MKGISTSMGVDHGGREWQFPPPPSEFGKGTLMQIVHPDFIIYRYKKQRSVAFIIRRNPFSAGAHLPRAPLGELTTLLQGPLVGWRGDTPRIRHPTRHRPTFGARHASPRIPARSTSMATSPTSRSWMDDGTEPNLGSTSDDHKSFQENRLNVRYIAVSISNASASKASGVVNQGQVSFHNMLK